MRIAPPPGVRSVEPRALVQATAWGATDAQYPKSTYGRLWRSHAVISNHAHTATSCPPNGHSGARSGATDQLEDRDQVMPNCQTLKISRHLHYELASVTTWRSGRTPKYQNIALTIDDAG